MCEKCREYNAAAVYFRRQAADAESRLAELQEAVRWEREAEEVHSIITEKYLFVSESAPEEDEISVSYFAARAAVAVLVDLGD